MAQKKDNEIVINDITELFTQDNANNGVWLQLVSMGKKYAVEVKVLGNDADEVQALSRKRLKEMSKHIKVTAQGGIFEDDDADEIDEVANNLEDVLVRFGGIRKTDGTPLSFNGEDIPVEKSADCESMYIALLRGMPELKDFIKRESMVRNNFLSKGKKN